MPQDLTDQTPSDAAANPRESTTVEPHADDTQPSTDIVASETEDMVPLPWGGRIGIRSLALTGIFLILLVFTLQQASNLLIPIFLAWMFNILLTPVCRRMNRWGLPMPLASALVVSSMIGLFVLALYTLSTPAAEWIERTPNLFSNIEQKIKPISEPFEEMKKTTEEIEAKVNDLTETKDDNVVVAKVSTPSYMMRMVTSIPYAMVGVGSFFVLLYFLLSTGDALLLKIVKITPKLRDKKRAVTIMREIESETSRYLMTISIINVILGLCATLILYLLEVPNPWMWGVMVGLLNFAPYIGPLISLAVISIVSLVTFDHIAHAIWVPLSLAILTGLEGQFITPMILGKRLLLSPVLVFISILFWGWLWGIAGCLMAVPILAILKVIGGKLDSFSSLSELIGR